MNKTIVAGMFALAVSTTAFSDVNITGDFIWGHHNTNGATETESDGDINFKATTETDSGLSIKADFNINESGSNDGGSSLTVAGSFGKLDLGDTSSATDKIDDVTDWGYFQTSGVGSVDHAVLYSLPTVVDGLTVHASYAADANQDGNDAGTAYSAQYDFGFAEVGYGVLNNDDDTEATLMNAEFSIAGVGVGYEVYTETDASGVDTDETAMGATYSFGDVTVGYENVTTESAGNTDNDITAFGVHYAIAPELTAFVETSEDDKTADSKATTIGLAYSF